MALKRAERKKVTLGDYDFYISKFGAFKASNLSAELVRFFGPMIGSIAPVVLQLLGDNEGSEDSKQSILDTDIEDKAPALAGAFSHLSGNELEFLLRKLLIEDKNIAFVERGCEDSEEAAVLKWDDADEIFCGEIQDMYRLAIEVIKVNYGGFFTKLAAPYGLDLEKMGAAMLASRNMAPLMSASSAN